MTTKPRKKKKQKTRIPRKAKPKVNTLTAEFEALLRRMQTPKARKAMDEAFHATPEELGKAAVWAARRRV